jgi:prolyl oligopeptidase
MEKNSSNPTLLYGYGGFQIPLTPSYLGSFARQWLDNGGVYVIANIRGGGEFGPKWHQAALKQNRQRAYDDFIAVGETLIANGITSSKNLGIRGGSNGGLLVGAVVAQRPDLFNAVICAVPLLDMYRYDKLLAGASWVDEYGDPDNPDEWSYISKYSPYQNVFAEREYPEIYFYTSTKDDRVHPGHARKMAKKMLDQGHKIIYYENIEGGHSAAANLKQSAYMTTLQLEYLKEKLL